MMDVTDRHFRALVRLLTRRTLLYTEMVVAQAVIHGDHARLLGYDPGQHPIALQLGGDDPPRLVRAARIAEDLGYDEVNLNVGCPSARVQSGSFGVVLMRRPERVAEAVAAMRDAVAIPVTVKHRIGLDELDRYEDMAHFVQVVAPAGCDRFTVHARKAWTAGLSPKQNRDVPPLRHAEVHRLKREHPQLQIEINGGITTLDEAIDHLAHVDGVMLGRAIRDRPYLLAEADHRVFGDPPTAPRPRAEVARALIPYLAAWLAVPGFKIHHLTRHLGALYAGERGARAFRRTLDQGRVLGVGVIEAALTAVDRAQDRRSALATPAGAEPEQPEQR